MKYAALFLLLLHFLLPSSSFATESRVYLLAKVKIKGTTYTQAVFFHEESIKNLAMCQKEIRYGHQGSWQHYQHFVRKARGMSNSVNYFCIETPIRFEEWYERARYKHVYLIRINGNNLILNPSKNYAACMAKLRQTQSKESYRYFCAVSNQVIEDQ